jgi:uncharacterized protein YndB with AHSA1/START domain
MLAGILLPLVRPCQFLINSANRSKGYKISGNAMRAIRQNRCHYCLIGFFAHGYNIAQESEEQSIMAHQAPLKYVFYIAATPEKAWEGFVSRESNRIIFSGAELQADFKPGGSLAWVGAGPDGKPMTYVRGKVLRFEPPKVFQYTFAMGQNDKASRATIELVPETEATKVTVTHDEWAEDDPTYAACADGWPRILSRLKTLLETGKTFKPHSYEAGMV